MRIAIAERLRPYSHEKGTRCLIPGTTLVLEAYPTLLRICDYAGTPVLQKEIALDVLGPVKNFTVQQDLEKGRVVIFGHGQKGYVKHVEKGSLSDFSKLERLSLGNHKAQDWTLMWRRLKFEEIFPLWFRLGQMIPPLGTLTHTGTLALLPSCEAAISCHKPETILPAFEKLFSAAFSDMLVPRLADDQHQGLSAPSAASQTSPLWHLTEGARLIRALFFKEELGAFHPLPALPPELHCGRLINLQTSFGTLDLEWTKKTLRRMRLHTTQGGTLRLQLPKDLRSFRLRKGEKDKGPRLERESLLKLMPQEHYFFDNFQA